jgi:hypothetical protein
MKLYHTTNPKSAKEIIENGFLGGWGDSGYGIYFYDNLEDAVAYGERGGWDHSLKSFVVLETIVDSSLVSDIEPDPAWPNPEDYDTVKWIKTNENEETPTSFPTKPVYQGASKKKRLKESDDTNESEVFGKGLTHIEDLSPERFLGLLRSLQLDPTVTITEKMDGMFLSFGIDASGFYVASKYAIWRSLGDFRDVFFLEDIRRYFQLLQSIPVAQVLSGGKSIEIKIEGEAIPSADHNIVMYDPGKVGEGVFVIYRVIIGNKQITDQPTLDKIATRLNRTSKVRFIGNPRVDLSAFKVPQRIMIDLENLLKKHAGVLGKAARTPEAKAVKQAVSDKIKELGTRVKSQMLAVPYEPALGKDIEGYVIHLPDGSKVKIVDKDKFTAFKKKNWLYSDQLKFAERAFRVLVNRDPSNLASAIVEWKQKVLQTDKAFRRDGQKTITIPKKYRENQLSIEMAKDTIASLEQMLASGKSPEEVVNAYKSHETLSEAKLPRQVIGYFPGAFKPPHRGHWNTIIQASQECDRVKVYASVLDRKKAGTTLRGEAVKAVWENFYMPALPGNVEVLFTEKPVIAAVEDIQELEKTPNNNFYVIYTGEDDMADKKRIIDNLLYATVARKRIKLQVVERSTSGSVVRQLIASGNLKGFTANLPEPLRKSAKAIFQVLRSGMVSEGVFTDMKKKSSNLSSLLEYLTEETQASRKKRMQNLGMPVTDTRAEIKKMIGEQDMGVSPAAVDTSAKEIASLKARVDKMEKTLASVYRATVGKANQVWEEGIDQGSGGPNELEARISELELVVQEHDEEIRELFSSSDTSRYETARRRKMRDDPDGDGM